MKFSGSTTICNFCRSGWNEGQKSSKDASILLWQWQLASLPSWKTNRCVKNGCNVRYDKICCFSETCHKRRKRLCQWMSNYAGEPSNSLFFLVKGLFCNPFLVSRQLVPAPRPAAPRELVVRHAGDHSTRSNFPPARTLSLSW